MDLYPAYRNNRGGEAAWLRLALRRPRVSSAAVGERDDSAVGEVFGSARPCPREMAILVMTNEMAVAEVGVVIGVRRLSSTVPRRSVLTNPETWNATRV